MKRWLRPYSNTPLRFHYDIVGLSVICLLTNAIDIRLILEILSTSSEA